MNVGLRSLLLGLLFILYLQICVEGQNGKAPEECCFEFYNRPVPVSAINGYKKTGPDCTNPGVIFNTTRGRLCMDPSLWWVKRAMDKIDQRIFEGLNKTG